MRRLKLRLWYWWVRVSKGRHSAYVVYDPEEFEVSWNVGTIIKQAIKTEDGMLAVSADMTLAMPGPAVIFSRKRAGAYKVPDIARA